MQFDKKDAIESFSVWHIYIMPLVNLYYGNIKELFRKGEKNAEKNNRPKRNNHGKRRKR